MNGIRTWILQDLLQVISKKPLQNASIACVHNTAPTSRFWSFFEFPKRDEQYLNRTKENESSEDQVDFSGTFLEFPRQHVLEIPSKIETTKDLPIFNIKIQNLRKDMVAKLDETVEDGLRKTKKFSDPIIKVTEIKAEKPKLEVTKIIKNADKNSTLKMAAKKDGLPITGPRPVQPWYGKPPRPPSIAPKNCPPPPKRLEFDAKSKCPEKCSDKKPKCPSSKHNPYSKGPDNVQSSGEPMMMKTQLKINFERSGSSSGSRIIRKQLPLKSCSSFFKDKDNLVQSGPMKMDKCASIFPNDNGKSSMSFMVSAEASRLRTTKSSPDQIVSRYSSGTAEPRFSRDSRHLGTRIPKPSGQLANMSSGNGRKNNRRNKKANNNNNNCQNVVECPPPPPPPECISPPPKKEKKIVQMSDSDCCPPPPPPCCPPPPEEPKMTKKSKKKKSKNDDWCGSIDPNNCFTSKCPKRKNKKPSQPRICPPKCFEPDPCEEPKAFCVNCPPKKKNSNDKCFSTWAGRNSVMIFASRSLASDTCGNNDKNKKGEEKFNRRIPKPGPACKEKEGNKCKPVTAQKINECKKPSSDENKCGKSPSVEKKCGKPPSVEKKCGEPPSVGKKSGEPPSVEKKCGEPPSVEKKCGEPPSVEKKCEEPSSVEKKCEKLPSVEKSCQKSIVSAAEEKSPEESVKELVKKEFEEVQKCKERTGKKDKSDSKDSKCSDKTSVEKTTDKEAKGNKEAPVLTGLERVISPCKLERMKKSSSENQESKCNIIAIENSIDSPYKSLLGILQQNNFSETQKNPSNYFPVGKLENNIWSDLNIFQIPKKGKITETISLLKILARTEKHRITD